MIALPPGARVYVACGVTDMRRGFHSLAAQVQTALQLDPYSGALFIFRGRRGDLLKALFWDGQGLVLYAKRLERGRFVSYGLCQPLWTGGADRPLRDGCFRMHTIRMGEDAEFLRRSLRLLCGDWLPHDDGASEGCLALAADVGVAACPTRIRGFPLPRPASSLMRIVGCGAQAPSGTRWPIDQTNPSSSRATAAVATTERFPRAVSRL